MLPAAGHVPGDPGAAAAVGPDARLRGGSPGGTWRPNEGWQLRWAHKIQSRSLLRHIRGTFWHWGGQNPWRADSADKPIGQHAQTGRGTRADGQRDGISTSQRADTPPSVTSPDGAQAASAFSCQGFGEVSEAPGGKGLRKGRRKARRPGTRGDEERGQRLHVLSPGHTDGPPTRS